MDHQKRHGAKVYGKKSFAPAASTAVAIFTTESPPLTSSRPEISPVRCALNDLTNYLSNFQLDSHRSGADKVGRRESCSEGKCDEGKSSIQRPRTRSAEETRFSGSKKKLAKQKDDPRQRWLEPLTKEYEKSGVHEMTIRKWANVLDEEWGLEKIAESSYAEVYRVSNSEGISVLKVMALKPPTGPGSQRETAVDVVRVVSEVLIMDMMAEIPGFLEFKGAHIIEGKPPRSIKGAYEAHAAKNESYFPKPSSYHKDQLFLVLELGDAGKDIEHFSVTAVSQIWDIFFGIVTALSHGEELASFEHRDLHEGNVCVKRVGSQKSCNPKQIHKFGYSGLEVTLIDYTLSRVTRGDVTIFRDLESDSELFLESNVLQHQMYRRMRNWVFFRSSGLSLPSSKRAKPLPQSTWKDFLPYTNVIWIYYLFKYTMDKYEGVLPLTEFLQETKQLRQKLDPDRRRSEGGFTCASDVLDYCVRQGWINERDLSDGDIESGLDGD